MNELTELSYALDTFYFLICGVLVMWMAAGFSMLEAGMVRSKNTAEILTKNIALFAIACTMYLLVGYYIMYSSGEGGFLPSLGFLIGTENSVDAVLAGGEDAPYYSMRSDFFFQVVFVATAMSIVSGAVAERMKLWAFLAFAVVMTAFIYPVSGYWTWGGGWLDGVGYSDYAGSGIVHMAGAAAALAGVLVLGPRKGKYGKDGSIHAIPGANMPLATLGTFILWMGWFGFNGGSELKMSDIGSANNVAQVFVNTNAAAAGGVIAALILAKLWFRKADLTMALNGALAGLVAITPAAGNVGPGGALILGVLASVAAYGGILLKNRLGYDDTLDVFGIHGIAGIVGAIGLTFLLREVPEHGIMTQLWHQSLGVIVAMVASAVGTLLLLVIVEKTVGLRLEEPKELAGMDHSLHGEHGYGMLNPN